MATGDRSKRILTRVQRVVKDFNKESIYDAVNLSIQRICEEASADQAKMSVSIVGGTELYDVPTGFIALTAILPSGSTELKRLTIDEVVEIKRAGVSLDNTTTDPIYFYLWNDQIGFMNPSGGAPSASATVYLYGWKGIKDDLSDACSDSVDPILHKRWDYCLGLGAISILSNDPGHIQRYELEFSKQKSLENSSKGNHWQVPVEEGYC